MKAALLLLLLNQAPPAEPQKGSLQFLDEMSSKSTLVVCARPTLSTFICQDLKAFMMDQVKQPAPAPKAKKPVEL